MNVGASGSAANSNTATMSAIEERVKRGRPMSAPKFGDVKRGLKNRS